VWKVSIFQRIAYHRSFSTAASGDSTVSVVQAPTVSIGLLEGAGTTLTHRQALADYSTHLLEQHAKPLAKPLVGKCPSGDFNIHP
jgi:hypothetical protein